MRDESASQEQASSAISRRSLVGLGGAVLLGGAADLAATSSAQAATAPAQPSITDRSGWRARPPKSAAAVGPKPDKIVVHHTATANTSNTTKAHALALSRSIQNYHMDHNGWADTGQQFTISRGGYIMEGRNKSLPSVRARRHAIGAHVAGHNSHTTGIECEGLYTSVGPPAALWRSLVKLCAWMCSQYGLTPSRAIVGHRNYNSTSCPGNVLYSRLPQLRREVAAAMALPAAFGVDAPTLPDLGVIVDEPLHEFDHGPARAPNERR